MLKKIFLILFFSAISFALRAERDCNCNSEYNELSTMGKVFVYGSAGIGIVAAAPVLLTAGAITTIANGVMDIVGSVITFITPTNTAGKVGLGLTAAQYVRPYIVQTTEEKRDQLLKEKQQKQYTAREEFITCLKQNKFGSVRNAAGRPSVCEDMALAYALVAGNANLNRRTEAFKEGKCFCS